MKYTKCLITIVLLINTYFTFSQTKKTDANVFGHVVEKSTNEHIPFVNIAVKGTQIGCATDATGHYFLKNLPIGKTTLIVSGVGYKTLQKEVKLSYNQTVELNFEIEKDPIMLEGIVVSANKNETNRKRAPVIVNVLIPKLFENTNSVCLAQGLSYQPGLRIENNCQSCGFSQVRINGLDGSYSQILIDSRPVFSSLAGVYGLEQIPANMIERVEVIRGGGSALFGSNAIAGTINILTKEPSANSVAVSNNTAFINGKTLDVTSNFNSSIVTDDYKAGVILFGSIKNRSPYDFDNDGFSEVPELKSNAIGLRGYYKTNSQSKFTLEYHNINEFRRGGNKFDLQPHQADIAEQLNHNINTGSVKYDYFSKNLKHKFGLYSSVQNIFRKSYYGSQQDLNAYGDTKNTSFAGGGQYLYDISKLIFIPAEFSAGIEYTFDKIKDNMPGYNRFIDQEVNTISTYIQNEWKNQKWSLLAGVRADKHSMLKDPIFSPRLNLRYSPMEMFNFRASFASGFRAPQTFDEDLHVSAVGGEFAFIQISPNLKTEKSNSISASIDYYFKIGEANSNILIEGFYTDLSNVFVLEQIGKDSMNNTILERRNGKGAVVKGINIEGRIVPLDKIQIQLGFTMQSSMYKEDQTWSENINLKPQKKMFRSPNKYGYITLNYQIANQLQASISGVYTGSMLVQHFAGFIPEDVEKETKEFLDLTFKLAKDFKLESGLTLQINGGVQNIFNSYQTDFDKGEFRDSAYTYGPTLPRTFFVGAKINI